MHARQPARACPQPSVELRGTSERRADTAFARSKEKRRRPPDDSVSIRSYLDVIRLPDPVSTSHTSSTSRKPAVDVPRPSSYNMTESDINNSRYAVPRHLTSSGSSANTRIPTVLTERSSPSGRRSTEAAVRSDILTTSLAKFGAGDVISSPPDYDMRNRKTHAIDVRYEYATTTYHTRNSIATVSSAPLLSRHHDERSIRSDDSHTRHQTPGTRSSDTSQSHLEIRARTCRKLKTLAIAPSLEHGGRRSASRRSRPSSDPS